MRVIDHEPRWWFLLENDGRLLLDVNCNHSFIGYDFMILLTDEEVLSYQKEGRAFINQLARRIQDSAPILEQSRSPYQGRDLSAIYAKAVTAAVQAWGRSI